MGKMKELYMEQQQEQIYQGVHDSMIHGLNPHSAFLTISETKDFNVSGISEFNIPTTTLPM